jgi:hypothetical protein
MARGSRVPDSFAKVEGSPGEKPRLVGFVRATWPLLLIMAAAGYLLRAALPVPGLTRTMIGFLLVLLCGVLAYSIVWSERRLSMFIKGARGEERVARVLAFLPSGYRVFHGLSMSSGMFSQARDYDHVVVGPTGVFVVETKNWSGKITMEDGKILQDGEEPDRPPLEQVKEGASDLRRRLAEDVDVDVAVQPVLCFVGGALQGGTTGASGVVVCAADVLESVITVTLETPLGKAAQEKVVTYLERLMSAE